MKGWLDNFGKADNANESNVSLPEDFVGLGYDTKGRNYSPAWGGQFAMGGSIPGSVGFTYARVAGAAPSKGKYAKKTMASAQTGKNNIKKDATNIDTGVANKIAGLELQQNPEYQYFKYLQSLPQLRQAPGRGEELMRKGLGYADVATDVMQMGNFIPHPIAQTISKIGNVAGTLIDAYQAASDVYKGNYTSAGINAASAILPSFLGAKTFRRNAMNLRPGDPLYSLTQKAGKPYTIDLNKTDTGYLELFSKVKGMKDKSLMYNRAFLGGLGAETAYDAGLIGPVKKEYGGEIPSAQKGKDDIEKISINDPRYPEMYKNRQVGLSYDGTISLPDLDEVTITAPRSYTIDSLRDFTTAALYGAPATAMKLEAIPQAAMTEGIEMLRGRPYDFSNVNPNIGSFSSNQRDLSQTLGYENPEGFLQNAVNLGLSAIDPLIISGVSKVASRQLAKKAVKAVDLDDVAKRKIHLQKLKDEKLIHPDTDINKYSKSLSDTEELTKKALTQRETYYRGVTPKIPEGPEQQLIIEEMTKAGVDISNPEEVGRYMATHVPLQKLDYNAGFQTSNPRHNALYTSGGFSRYGDMTFEMTRPLDFSKGSYSNWLDELYKYPVYNPSEKIDDLSPFTRAYALENRPGPGVFVGTKGQKIFDDARLITDDYGRIKSRPLPGLDEASVEGASKQSSNKVGKITGLRSGITADDVNNLIDKNINYIESDEYLQRRMATTGESKEQVLKDVSKYKDRLKNTTINLSASGEGGLMDPLNIPYLTNKKIKVGKGITDKEEVLGVLDHEIKHMLSPASEFPLFSPNTTSGDRLGKYFNYPELEINSPVGKYDYFRDPMEQQVRMLKLNEKIRQDLGIKDIRKITEKEFDSWKGKHLDETLNNPRYRDFKQIYEDATDKGRSDLLNTLNRLWAAPAVGVVGAQAIEQNRDGGSVKQFQNGGEMKFYQNGLDWKPKSMQDGGKIYEGQELPEFVVEGKDERIKEAMSQGINKFYGHVGELMGAPQKEMMQLITGKEQTPSQAFGFQDTGGWLDSYSSFGKNLLNTGLDLGLDPVNALGVGLIDDITRGGIRLSAKQAASSAINTKNNLLRAIKGTGSFVDQVKGEVLQGKANRESIKLGNEWLQNWIDNPITRQKIDADIDKAIALKGPDATIDDLNYLELVRNQSKDFMPYSKEYSLYDQLNDNIDQYLRLSNTRLKPMHDKNMGVSQMHGFDPQTRELIARGLMPAHRHYGSFISRKTSIPQVERQYTTIHEGTHDWVPEEVVKKLGMRNIALKNINPEAKKYLLDVEAGLKDQLTDEQKYLGYLADPTEQHARIMELRGNLGLTPDDVVDENLAKEIIKKIKNRETPVDPKFLKVIDSDPLKLAERFNRFWAVPAVGAVVGSQAVDKQKNGGITKDNQGYWNPENWGKPVEIDSNDITMEGVYEPLLGISDTGDTKLMKPGKNYKFKGKKVTEYPVAKLGINQLDAQPMKKLNQLLNFTNNPDKDNWLDKYN